MGDPNQAMEILKEELDSYELYHRVNAIHRINIIATILGADGIKNQLLPFLDQLIKKEEDEVLYAIAGELIKIAPILGSSQTILIPYLETLASQEETVVRERSVQSLIELSKNLSDSEIISQYIPVIFRLASNDQNFTCRVSAVHLMVPIYKRAGSQKDKIRQKFTELCSEETPMVRRTVATLIGQMATEVEKEYVLSDLIGSVKQLIQDDQDQVRVLGLNSLKHVAKVLSKEENRQLTLQIIIAATEDKSWRVRLSLSKIFAELAEAFGKEVADVSLIQIFTNLLRDAENDVRQASIQSLAKFITIVSAQRLVIILPHLQYLAKDSVPQVRAGTTDVIGIMSGLLQNKEMVTSKLLPHILEMFNDENKEVRDGVMRSAATFCMNVGNDSIQQFIPHFKKAIEDPKWRVRCEAYSSLIKIAKHINNLDMFQKQFEPIILNFLKDKVSAVRESVVNQLVDLIKTYKSDWVFNRLLPKVIEQLSKENDNYLFRLICLNTLRVICVTLKSDNTVDKIFPILYKYINDPVPNIRIFIAKAFLEIIPRFDSPSVKNDVKSHLTSLANDNDKDVKYYYTEIQQIIGK